MDIDEDAFRENRVSARLYGYLSVPYERTLVQSAKAGGVAGDESTMAAIADDVISGMQPGLLYILGPGTTTRAIMERLGLPKTLLGVDAVRDRRSSAAISARTSSCGCSSNGRARPASWSPSSAARGTSSAAATSRSARAC